MVRTWELLSKLGDGHRMNRDSHCSNFSGFPGFPLYLKDTARTGGFLPERSPPTLQTHYKYCKSANSAAISKQNSKKPYKKDHPTDRKWFCLHPGERVGPVSGLSHLQVILTPVTDQLLG